VFSHFVFSPAQVQAGKAARTPGLRGMQVCQTVQRERRTEIRHTVERQQHQSMEMCRALARLVLRTEY